MSYDYFKQHDYDHEQTVVSLLKKSLKSNRDKTAIVCADKTLTYGELDRLSNKIANYLGKTVRDDIAESIESVCQEIPVSYPVMLYALRYGDMLSLQLVQVFDDPVYSESLRKTLVQYGWAI